MIPDGIGTQCHAEPIPMEDLAVPNVQNDSYTILVSTDLEVGHGEHPKGYHTATRHH